MTTHIHCPTDHAVLLLALEQAGGPFVFPADQSAVPGLHFKPDLRLPINPQLFELAHQHTGLAPDNIYIWQSITLDVTLGSGESATVYVAKSTIPVSPRSSENQNKLKTLPDLMREMPPTRNRVAYMKAMQVFSGALEEQTKALDLDEVRRHINSLQPKTEH